MPLEGASAPSSCSVRFGEEDFAIFRMRTPTRRAEALQERVLPKLDAIGLDAPDEVRATYGVEPFDYSIISRWPNFRPRRESELEHLYLPAFVGVGGQHALGKWLGAARRD